MVYEYARAGVTLEREARNVVIHELEFLAYDAPLLSLKVKCSKGTYIRSLAYDFGKAMNSGSHLTALRRTKIGDYNVINAVDVTAFEENLGKEI